MSKTYGAILCRKSEIQIPLGVPEWHHSMILAQNTSLSRQKIPFPAVHASKNLIRLCRILTVLPMNFATEPLKKVDYLSDYDPLKDEEIIRESIHLGIDKHNTQSG